MTYPTITLPHKELNRGYFGTGNMLTDHQYSGFIRPSSQTECNGYTSEVGHLQDFDMQPFREYLDSWTDKKVRGLVDQNNGGILYVIRHFNNRRRIIDGVVLTTTDHKKELLRLHISKHWKAWESVDLIANHYYLIKGE